MAKLNDASLYSGMTSPARQAVVAKKAEETRPDPKAEDVLVLIAKERAALMSIEHIVIGIDMSDDEVRRKLQSVRDQYEFLNRLERKMKQLLGIKIAADKEKVQG
jgi:hypothetical protein